MLDIVDEQLVAGRVGRRTCRPDLGLVDAGRRQNRELVLHAYELLLEDAPPSAKLQGAIVLGDPAQKAALPKALADAFGDKSYVEVKLALTPKTIVISPRDGAAFELKLESAKAIAVK